MKLFILTITLFFCSQLLYAQVTINLIVSNRPPANLSEWAAKKEVVTLIINNIAQGVQRRVKIKTTVKTTDGTEVSVTDLNLAPVITLPDGNTVLNASTVYPLEIQKFNGTYQRSLQRAGKLPADNYQFCVQLVNSVDFAPVTNEVCKIFFVAALQLPILMMPQNGQQLDIQKAKTAITFRWTPLVPRPQGAVGYRLQVFEILAGQQAVQALRSNQPVLDKIVNNQTQFIWQPQLGFITDATQDSATVSTLPLNRFIWTIQTIENNSVITEGSNEGRSEPLQFSVGTTLAEELRKKKNDKN